MGSQVFLGVCSVTATCLSAVLLSSDSISSPPFTQHGLEPMIQDSRCSKRGGPRQFCVPPEGFETREPKHVHQQRLNPLMRAPRPTSSRYYPHRGISRKSKNASPQPFVAVQNR